MDTLFTTSIIINGESKSYDVSFANETYIFTLDSEDNAPAFKLRREEDEWKLEGNLTEISRQQAIAALDSYLLSQH